MKTARIYLKESIAVYNSLSFPVQQLAYLNQLGQAMLTSLIGNASVGNRRNFNAYAISETRESLRMRCLYPLVDSLPQG